MLKERKAAIKKKLLKAVVAFKRHNRKKAKPKTGKLGLYDLIKWMVSRPDRKHKHKHKSTLKKTDGKYDTSKDTTAYGFTPQTLKESAAIWNKIGDRQKELSTALVHVPQQETKETKDEKHKTGKETKDEKHKTLDLPSNGSEFKPFIDNLKERHRNQMTAKEREHELKTLRKEFHDEVDVQLDNFYTLMKLRKLAKIPNDRVLTKPDLMIRVSHEPEFVQKRKSIQDDLLKKPKYLLITQYGSGKMGKDDMTTDQIESLMKDVPGFQCAVARDEGLPIRKHASRMAWVKNLDPHTKDGSHWVAIVVTPTSAEYVDSLGDPVPIDILKQIVKVAPKHAMFLENTKHRQSDSSSRCGYFACKFILDRANGKTFNEASPAMGPKHAEKIIKSFERKHQA